MPATDVGAQQTINSEEFWDDLLAYIEDGRVVPVVGPEIHTVAVDGRALPLYRAIAEQLLKKYGLEAYDANDLVPPSSNGVALRKHLELNDAVSALSNRGRRVADLYRPINDELRRLLGAQPAIPQPLLDLAGITDFTLFVTTTFDDLLARAIDSARTGYGPATDQIAYAPNLPGDQANDLTDDTRVGYRAVFHLFGRASPSPFFAIDDEDVLEFIYSLQAEKGIRPERMLAELRRCHLLLIGCNFADWLSRFFIRLANQVRLSGDRPKKEFLVGDEVAHDQSLTLFLERFSHNTRVYPGDPSGFVSELLRRWRERRPQAVESGISGALAPPARESALGLLATENIGAARLSRSPAGGVFISYSHEDIAPARLFCSELASIGAGVIWFDRTQLKPGDEWDEKIKAGLKSCDLFVPLISSNTEAQHESYFHVEWRFAEERSKFILGRSFIIPIVVDTVYNLDPNWYMLVPEGFRALQFGHAPGGRMSEDLRKLMVDALRELRRRRPG
jgi:TIR domain/SIR2-like domain